MISSDDVKKLARLSRLSLTDEEVKRLEGEMDSIIAYVDIVQKIPTPDASSGSVYLDIENVMREDAEAHPARAYTEKLTEQFPRRDGDYLKVKKILG